MREQPRPVQIRPFQAPQHNALTRPRPPASGTLSRSAGEGYNGWIRAKPGEDAGDKAGSGGAVLLIATLA